MAAAKKKSASKTKTAAKKAVKKVSKATVKKATKSATKKAVTAKAPAKKAVKKTAKPPARKAAPKTAKAAVKKAAAPKKATAKKTAGKAKTPAPAPKPARKTASKKATSAKSASRKSNIKMPTEAQLRRMPEKDYMNEVQLHFFRERLLQMRDEVIAREVDVKQRLHQREIFADPADRATAEEEHWLDLRLRERESLLIRKIDEALRRIQDKDFGYCEVTGEAIGVPRLLARPTATVCVDVKGQNEHIEAQYRDR